MGMWAQTLRRLRTACAIAVFFAGPGFSGFEALVKPSQGWLCRRNPCEGYAQPVPSWHSLLDKAFPALRRSSNLRKVGCVGANLAKVTHSLCHRGILCLTRLFRL
jgi:hypothetical protein